MLKIRKIDWNRVGMYICTIGLVYALFSYGQSKPVTEANIAKCESMGGVYGGGKCFVNGFDVDNQ